MYVLGDEAVAIKRSGLHPRTQKPESARCRDSRLGGSPHIRSRNLICSWSNNESLFIYVPMILLHIDEASAAVVFATGNTTHARLDLGRLAKIRVGDKALAKNPTSLIERFSESTKVRNELNQ